MKISLLAFTASVQATFQAPGKIPTGNRRHFMTLRTVTDENGQEKTGGIAYGADYGMSGDLVSGNMFNTWLEAAEESGEDVDIKDKILWGQVQNDETWFYYQSPLNDQWYKAIYMPFEEPAFSQLGHEETKEINGTEVYGLFQCNDAVKKLYASEVNGGTDAENDALKAECEEKCLLYTEATDFTNAKDCNDPAGSLPVGAKGYPHPWLAPLYEFIEQVEEKVENGDATNYILDFEAPHTVGSKLFPELEDGEPDDVNATQLANTIADLENLNKDNITATFGDNDIEVICRLLRSGGADVICGDEAETTEEDEVVDDKVEEDDDSGFVINSVSLALFAVIAIFK